MPSQFERELGWAILECTSRSGTWEAPMFAGPSGGLKLVWISENGEAYLYCVAESQSPAMHEDVRKFPWKGRGQGRGEHAEI
jgi:hypothetical protein